jgi:hypothetical protein
MICTHSIAWEKLAVPRLKAIGVYSFRTGEFHAPGMPCTQRYRYS